MKNIESVMHLINFAIEMKGITIILSFIILFLAIKPCSDGNNFEDKHADYFGLSHNHQNDSDDSCSIMCSCSCCGMSILSEPIIIYNVYSNLKISTLLFFTYQSYYRFDFDSNIWQPPRLINYNTATFESKTFS